MTSLPSSSPAHPPYRFFIISGALLLGLFFTLQYLVPGQQSTSPNLPIIKSIPPFNLTERSNRSISNGDLEGKIWVADFIFTTCPGPCPLVTAGMVKIQSSLNHDPQVQLVTFTVDPDDDTPTALRAYADRFGADLNRWWFLTGNEKQLYDLIQNGFLLGLTDNRGQALQEGQYLFTHSTRLALVDGRGNLRGFYDGLTEDGRNRLLQAIATLKKEN